MDKANLFVLGCGRSGTSLVAGLFRNAGYFMGENLLLPQDGNPLGFFEDREVNSINEDLIGSHLPQRFSHQGIGYGADIPARRQRWLARLPLDARPEAAPAERERIRALVRQTPFCFKDPRFCYTLHLWRREVPNARCLCVFRDPREVVASMLKEIRSAPYLRDLAISVEEAFEIWRTMHQHVLGRHSQEGEWLFVRYDDLFRADMLDRVESFAGAAIDRGFPRRDLRRSAASLPVDAATAEIFAALRERAAG